MGLKIPHYLEKGNPLFSYNFKSVQIRDFGDKSGVCHRICLGDSLFEMSGWRKVLLLGETENVTFAWGMTLDDTEAATLIIKLCTFH